MTIEQLLCPAVIDWEENFRKKLNESNIDMSSEQIIEEFDKWLIENEDVINKSVEDNIEHINETIQRNMKKHNKLNEGFVDYSDDDDDENDDDENDDDENDDDENDDENNDDFEFGDDDNGPVTGGFEGDEDEDEDEEQEKIEKNKNSITGVVTLTDDKKSSLNIFTVINNFYDLVVVGKNYYDRKHTAIMSKLDVSKITNMCALFAFTDLPNIDLSSWNTGNVQKMEGMFYKSTFNNDSICGWDVHSCDDFRNMFLFCPFNRQLNKWTPKEIEDEDNDGNKIVTRANPPAIGGTEDEIRSAKKIANRRMFDDFISGETTYESKNNNNNKMIHLVDYDTFINEGKFRDFIDRGVEKVKKTFNTIMLKFGDIVAFFKKNGEMYPAISAYTSMNIVASGKVPGVSVFTAVENEFTKNIDKEASIVPSAEYYGIIDKDSVEYRNYLTFVSAVNEHYQKYGDTGALVGLNEDENYKRVGLSAKDGGIDVLDINSKQLEFHLKELINNVPAYVGSDYSGAMLIFGAPGIGKSTIPKSIINKWNEKKGDSMHKKALMVIECGELSFDGFSVPIPVKKSIGEYVNDRSNLKHNLDYDGKSIENIKDNSHTVSIEAIKTWLPVFKMDSNEDEIDILNDIANGYLEIKDVNGRVVKQETTEGGILLLDEFFRAKENIFNTLMELVLKREYQGYRLGNKWGILCCTNRPNDDEKSARGLAASPSALGNRFAGIYNFIPSFDEWKTWALKEGGFDLITIEFLMLNTDIETGEYTNWHTIRPDEYETRGKLAWPTPRSWAELIKALNLYKKNNGYNSIPDILDDDEGEEYMYTKAAGIIGVDMADSYINYLKTYKKFIEVDVNKIMEDPNYVIPETSKCANVTRQIQNYIIARYSSKDLPPVDYMMNMFNNLERTYGYQDNIIKLTHYKILANFDVLENAKNRNALKDYMEAVKKRYGLTKADLKS